MINVLCPDCDGVGWLEDRKGNEFACPFCKGRGEVSKDIVKESLNGNQTEEN